jgi:hypothetical protein
MILPLYFNYNNGWYISPEQNAGSNFHPDYTVSRVDLTPGNFYGRAVPHLIVELKRPVEYGGVSWKALLDQAWDAADGSKHDDRGKLWVIGQRGFEICFFKFDILEYDDSISPDYTNLIPLNLNDWTEEDFKEYEIQVITEKIRGNNEVRVIYWRLDNPIHAPYIHDMFIHVSTYVP